ncbi:MAG TPA: alpha/beta fold hydrolase [Terracidiphilus sp.]|nr:alpha/beta fold hydrolase [Terracidiphilus sp.]
MHSASARDGARLHSATPTVSGRWLLTAVALVIPCAAFCAWAVLCLLFWQGSWQLLYHPTAAVRHTPASIGLAFAPVGFATTDTGAPRLQGWWIPSDPSARYTVLYLHGQNGNLGDTLDDLAWLHGAGVNVLAFDYRGYGQSQFVHPSEARWRQDADWALQYLTATRHVDPRSVVLDGSDLGANLALEIAASHPEFAGVVLESPIDAPVNTIFGDPRARLVPAHLLVRDRFGLDAPAAALSIPSLWFLPEQSQGQSESSESSGAFQKVTAQKMRVWLAASSQSHEGISDSLSRWLDDLHK